MDSYIAINKGKKILVILDDKAVVERHSNRILSKARFIARKDELKKQGYRIQHVGIDTIEGRRIEKSKPVQRQRKVRVLGYRVNI